MARITSGQIRIVEGDDERVYGVRDERFPRTIRLDIESPDFWPSVALGGTAGSGEAWMRGDWRCDDLTGLIRLILFNRHVMEHMDYRLARITESIARIGHSFRRNHRRGSRRNVSAHYDLGNDFFELFLDPTLTYSSGIFETPEASMESASRTKYERICRVLDLGPDDHVLEIGSGWGGFALHAASTRGCRVTTTTVSEAQLAEARRRVAEAGLADRIEVRFDDYRDLTGRYDKLVSIEMIEAVGYQYLETFFQVCHDRLKPGGRMALQAIVCKDEEFERSAREVDFIKRFIFPGGCLPSLGELSRCAARTGGLRLSGGHDITHHYAETLRRWREKLHKNLEAIRERGYPDELIRLWEFYFCYCEAGFEERHVGTVQVELAKSG